MLSYNEGCLGTTIFRDGSKPGVLSGLEKIVELVQNEVELNPRINKKAQAIQKIIQISISISSSALPFFIFECSTK